MGAAASRAALKAAVPKPPPGQRVSEIGVRLEQASEAAKGKDQVSQTSEKRGQYKNLKFSARKSAREDGYDAERAAATRRIASKSFHDRDEGLLERLKGVYVESKDEKIEHPARTYDIGQKKRDWYMDELIRARSRKKKMSHEKEPGVQPLNVPEGYATSQQIMMAIAAHSEEPEKWTVDLIAEQLNLKKKDVENVLLYCGTFARVEHVPNPLRFIEEDEVKSQHVDEMTEGLKKDLKAEIKRKFNK